MSHKQVRLLLSDMDRHSEWFRFRNINKWIHKFWKPRILGMYVGKYEGKWKDGQMHGMGTLRIFRIIRGYLFGWKLLNEGKYIGKWKNGKEHGKGIRTYHAGLMNNYNGKYEGEWKNGLEHGHGTKTWPDGKKFIGKWKKGKYFHGTYYFDNGDKHFGFFKDGVAKGHGIRTYFDGRKYTRTYTGKFKCREKRSEGTCILTGKKTVGRFIESIPTGFDTNKNYIGCQTVKYKEEKRASFISYFFYN